MAKTKKNVSKESVAPAAPEQSVPETDVSASGSESDSNDATEPQPVPKNKISASSRAGLTFPVSRVQKNLKIGMGTFRNRLFAQCF